MNYPILILLLILIISCNEKKIVEADIQPIFNKVNLMEYNGKKAFYLLDTLDRLNYKDYYPIENFNGWKSEIIGFYLVYSDSIKIEIFLDSLIFIPKISRCYETYEHDSSWTIDNFLKEKIKYVKIQGVKNGEFIFVSSYKKNQ